jgi:hypothetical protein
MKKFLAFIVLICHVNFTMLLPQVPEQDIVLSNGQKVDDINSVLEFIDQVVFGHEDPTPDDEDDDNGQNFLVVKSLDFIFQSHLSVLGMSTPSGLQSDFSDYMDGICLEPIFDTLSPPPKA